jgi:hypothetical protein
VLRIKKKGRKFWDRKFYIEQLAITMPGYRPGDRAVMMVHLMLVVGWCCYKMKNAWFLSLPNGWTDLASQMTAALRVCMVVVVVVVVCVGGGGEGGGGGGVRALDRSPVQAEGAKRFPPKSQPPCFRQHFFWPTAP